MLTCRLAEKVLRTTPSQSHTEAGTPRRRAQRACAECHLHKTKCSGELPQCKRCRANNLGCVYTAAKRNFSTAPASENSSQDDAQPRMSSMTDPTSAASIDSADGPFASYIPSEPADGLAAEYETEPPVPSYSMLTSAQHHVQEGPFTPSPRRLL